MDKTKFVQITRQDKIAEDEFYPMIIAMHEEIWRNLLPPQIVTNGLSVKRASNVITPPDAPVPDCLTCGVCCGALLCVGVRPDEELPAEDFWDITIEGKDGEIAVDRYLRRDPETLACAFLNIQAGEPRACKIYDRRPQVCHDFDAGSDKCHALRRAYGIEPFLSLDEMSEALEKLDQRPVKSLPSETIREVKFVETDNGDLQISAFMRDGSVRTIHTFNPTVETWRQFEFDALSLSQAADLIASRKK
ncbi:MAG TPA: YkgJ family cysteine cluster protein [Pyrinomonadaceae bacterium]|jgi:Fe-S-cluster containining protein